MSGFIHDYVKWRATAIKVGRGEDPDERTVLKDPVGYNEVHEAGLKAGRLPYSRQCDVSHLLPLCGYVDRFSSYS